MYLCVCMHVRERKNACIHSYQIHLFKIALKASQPPGYIVKGEVYTVVKVNSSGGVTLLDKNGIQLKYFKVPLSRI